TPLKAGHPPRAPSRAFAGPKLGQRLLEDFHYEAGSTINYRAMSAASGRLHTRRQAADGKLRGANDTPDSMRVQHFPNIWGAATWICSVPPHPRECRCFELRSWHG